MYAVGRLGSYISRGVYTFSGPFHPFGGAVDIIVVEQPDGSFKSSPWYVKFGKFQGVLKAREKLVQINVNGVDANFHMYLDHKGEAYFIREVDAQEGESVLYPSSSGDETDGQFDSQRRPTKSKSCNYDAGNLDSANQIDMNNGKIVARTRSRRAQIFGLVFGRRSIKEDSYHEGEEGTGLKRLSSLESAEIAADLLEVKWSTNLASSRFKKDKIPKLSTHDSLAKKNANDIQINDVRESKSSVQDNLENIVYHPVSPVETDSCNEPRDYCSSSGLENLEYPVEVARMQTASVSTVEQAVEVSPLGESISEERWKVTSQKCGMMDENNARNFGHDETAEGSIMGMTGPDPQIQYKFEACPGKQFDEEHFDNEADVLQGRGISNGESIPDRFKSFVYCETSRSSVVTSEGSNEQTHGTLCLSNGGNSKVHIHAETLLSTTKLLTEETVFKQAEDMEFHLEDALKVPESYNELVSAGPVLGLIRALESHSSCTTSSFGEASQFQNEKTIENDIHPSLESVGDSQSIYGDSDPRKSASSLEASEEEQFLFSDIDEFKLNEPGPVNEDNHLSICTENEVNGLVNQNHPSVCKEDKEINGLPNLKSDSYSSLDKFILENPSTDLENPTEKPGVGSSPISIIRSNRVAGEMDKRQTESLPNMWSPVGSFCELTLSNSLPMSHSLYSNSESMKLTSLSKDDSSLTKSAADEEHQLVEEKPNSEDSQTLEKLKNVFNKPAVEISLCKHLLYEGMGADAASQAFDAEKLDMNKYCSLGPAAVKNDKLVVRICGRYLPWEAAAPILLGMVTFGSEMIFEPKGMIPIEKPVEGDQSKAIDSNNGSWMLWPFSFKRSGSRKQQALSGARILDAKNAADCSVVNDDDKNLQKPKQLKKMQRLKTPTSEQLASLNLREGRNSVTFTFFTPMLGKQQVDARIYLWKWNTRIVISDVDGTITKSDVLGQFMPMVGIDWSQTGVAHLFSAIKENGYELLFLSARAISQAYHTRQFLVNLKQDGKALPDGPIVISPDGLFPSLFREVIRRAPHEFKIACLEDIKALFPPDVNPFYAGFGNRDTDEISYLKVGIPKGKIFIINPKGEVAVNRRVDTKSYTSLHVLVNGMFPPMASSEQEDFNSWNFWKLPPTEIGI